MRKINGQIYSLKQFDAYKLRIMVRVYSSKIISPGHAWDKESLLTFYTDEDCIEEAKLVITEDIFTDKIISWKFEHVATQEQDRLTSKFIKETLKDW